MGSFARGTLIAALLGLCAQAYAGPKLEAVSSKPGLNTFILGEAPNYSFKAEGLAPNASSSLEIEIVDEFEKPLLKTALKVSADASGKWASSFIAPASKLGFYKLKAKLSDGTALPSVGSKPAGFVSYCVVPDPAKRETLEQKDAFFFTVGVDYIDSTNYLGGHWTHTGAGYYEWKANEPTHSGEFAEARAKAKAQGKPFKQSIYNFTTGSGDSKKPWRTYQLLWLFNPPDWAIEKDSRAYTTGILTPDGEKAWIEYAKAAAAAYAEDHPEEPEHVYQITWEPHYPWGFKGTDEQLVRIYELVYKAIHDADPKAVVVGPAGSHFLNSWHEALLKKGLGKYIDGFSIHPYCDIPGERNELIPLIRQLKAMVKSYCGREIPFYGTEQGSSKRTPLEQAQGVIREHLIMLGEGYKANVAFLTFDFGLDVDNYGYYYNLHPKAQFGTKFIQPKPVAPAYAALTFLLDGWKSAGPIDWLGGTSMGYSYERNGQARLALWDFGDAPRKVSIPVGVESVTVYDWMGNASEVKTENGFLILELANEPRYVSGVSPKLWGSSAEKPLSLDSSKVMAFPGGKAVISGNVKAPAGEALEAVLNFEPDSSIASQRQSRSISLAPGASQPFSFELSIPQTMKASSCGSSLTLLDSKGRVIAGSGCALQTDAPIAMDGIRPCFGRNGSKGFKFTLKDAKGSGAKGSVSCSLQGVPESAKSLEFALKPGASEELEMDLGDLEVPAQRVLQADFVLKTDGGYAEAKSVKANFMRAPKLSAAPKFDGSLSAWESVPSVRIAGREYVLRSPQFYKGEDSLSASFRYAWDDKRLYFACEVKDETHFNDQTGWDTWNGDSLQLDFDLDPFLEEKLSGNTLADESAARKRYSQIDLALTAKGPEAFRTISPDPKKLPLASIDPKEISLSIVRKDGFTVYEAAIPWTTLGGPASFNGSHIGIGAEVNDRDFPKDAQRDVCGLFLFQTHKAERLGFLCLESSSKKP